MIEIELSLHRKARIWTDEFPKACFKPNLSIKEKLPTHGGSLQRSENHRIAVELFIPVGARVIYGLLGAEFIKHLDNVLLFEIYSSNLRNTDFDSMNQTIDEVYVGLPLMYSESVKNGVLQFFKDERKPRPNGSLVFKCAAYGEVGSNEVIFEQLATIICNYLFSNEKFAKKEDYLKLFSPIL